MQPPRSPEACGARRAEWPGRVVAEGDGGSQPWGTHRHTCWAPLLRPARGGAAKPPPALAAWGRGARKAWQRLCPRAPAPPTGGQGQAGSASCCPWIGRYRERHDAAGQVASRWQRERASLWVLLMEHGVAPTNHRAQRAGRWGGRGRKRATGTASMPGTRGGERSVSLRHPCRQRGQVHLGRVGGCSHPSVLRPSTCARLALLHTAPLSTPCERVRCRVRKCFTQTSRQGDTPQQEWQCSSAVLEPVVATGSARPGGVPSLGRGGCRRVWQRLPGGLPDW
jgi:hypothetical protein